MTLSTSDIEHFTSIVGADFMYLSAHEKFERYTHDETEDLRFEPSIVLLPKDAHQISAILSYCNRTKIPVTTRGAGTGLSGGALASEGGVLLSTERLNNILEINDRNGYVITEPAVITEVLQDTLKQRGWFYPPDPASRGSCFIGGNVAENSGGPKAVKYGVVKDYVLNLEIVLPDGAIIWTGANVIKNATGYNLTQLIVGSEGTLAVITKIVLKIIPHPRFDVLLLAPFQSATDACAAVASVFSAGITPSAMEFMERDAIEWAMKFTGSTMTLPDSVQAHLLIELDGSDLDILMAEAERVSIELEKHHCGELLFADHAQQKSELWKLRRSVAEAVKANSVYKEEDTVVPRAHLPELLQTVKQIGLKYGFQSVCYGHAGDGNLHVNIIKGNLSDPIWHDTLPKAISELFTEVVRLGGTLSGEHGIGLVQKNYMPIALNQVQLSIMKKIKLAFDPNNILNPNKIFPDR
ncbi:MAG: FAD-binding protein [Bacteroidetes bacterium]|nr:FAD-binding protein [Bacteroidota bacterium]